MCNCEVIIREFCDNDRNAVAEFFALLQDDVAQMDFLNVFRKYDEFSIEDYFQCVVDDSYENGGMIFVAECEEKVVGVIAGRLKNLDEKDLLEMHEHKRGHVSDLYVDASMRGRGVGKMLLTKMEDFLRDAGCAYLDLGCFSGNVKGHKFYEKMGYRNFVTDMAKNLT